MGYTLISRQKVDFNNTPITQLDFTINADYDEIFFTITGFKSTTDERSCGYQFITSGASGYDREIQSTVWGQWLYAYDYSHGTTSYEHAWDSDVGEASSSSTQFARVTMGGDTHKAHSAASGELVIYKPADTSFYKYFLSEAGNFNAHVSDFQQYQQAMRTAGYVKETAALTGIRFVSCNYAGDQDANIAYVDIGMYGLS